ncbi:MAG TPA: hypothetical protein VF233_11675 [Nitrososphaeraceae archaeon]
MVLLRAILYNIIASQKMGTGGGQKIEKVTTMITSQRKLSHGKVLNML